MKNYRYVKQYHNTKVTKKDIKKALKTAWLQTPSKNNFMPYKVHVLGPQFEKEKAEVYWLCLRNQTKADDNLVNDRLALEEHDRTIKVKPDFRNILTASHVLIFTQRVEDSPNQDQVEKIAYGHVYEQMATEGEKKRNARSVARIEIGMFSTNFASECLRQGIDISHTLCFPTDKNDWPQEYFPFLDEDPLLVMTVGYGKIYREYKYQIKDPKPDFHRIINIARKFD